MITIRRAELDKLISHAKSCLPEEGCGLVGGRTEGNDRHIEAVYLLENKDHSDVHFSIDPKDQIAAIKDMRSKGLVQIGNWHSHPETPSRPSEEDIRLSYDSTSSYLILSIMDRDAPVLNSFRVAERRDVTKEELVIIE